MSSNVFPFELVIRDNTGKELFINTVESVLKENLQCEHSFGCNILNCHTHVGSKKHLASFVEAELLFHNSYYNKGFAFCTVELLKNKIFNYKKIMLVGYETFGEMYICEVAGLLREKMQKLVHYCIAETIGDIFRIRSSTDKSFLDNEVFFAFIVPINTTLTTHDKLLNKFKNWLKNEVGKTYILNDSNSINIGLIMIAPKQNNDYWEIVSRETREIRLVEDKRKELIDLGDRKVSFLAEVESEWSDSEKCRYCFPDLDKKDLIEEKAIFEVNRASVVPMLQLRVESVPEPFEKETRGQENVNIVKLFLLTKYLTHHHIVRNGSHYQYYFDTQKYFQEMKTVKGLLSLENWLNDIVKTDIQKRNTGNAIVYNFIVSPRHYSNAGFVQCVNDVVFAGSARILYFDVTKEYRGNVKAKYSDLTRLVDNIISSRQPAKLCFHYVDDTIFSGANFLRTKNLLNTLVDVNKSQNLCTKSLFDSVIILLGRNSDDSKKWFVENSDTFFEYVHLSISPMRNHEDACTLCKMVRDYEKLEKLCATNEMSESIISTIMNHKKEEIVRYSEEDCNGECATTMEKRARVILRHLLMVRLNNKWRFYDDERVVNRENVEDIYYIIQLFYNDIFEKVIQNFHLQISQGQYGEISVEMGTDIDFKIALIKVISRPFFCYHIRQKQAALRFCLKLLNEKLSLIESCGEKMEYNGAISDDDSKIIKALINALADLNSTYLIRADTISKMMRLIRANQYYLNAIDYYRAIKKIIGMSSDHSKSVLLEHILVEGGEKNFLDIMVVGII